LVPGPPRGPGGLLSRSTRRGRRSGEVPGPPRGPGGFSQLVPGPPRGPGGLLSRSTRQGRRSGEVPGPPRGPGGFSQLVPGPPRSPGGLLSRSSAANAKLTAPRNSPVASAAVQNIRWLLYSHCTAVIPFILCVMTNFPPYVPSGDGQSWGRRRVGLATWELFPRTPHMTWENSPCQGFYIVLNCITVM